jgi:hypothetical protein
MNFMFNQNYNTMKTLDLSRGRTSKSYFAVMMVLLNVCVLPGFGQETKTLFKSESKIGFMWGFELKTASIQHEPATQFGLYGGALFYHAVMIGAVGAANVTHPRVNYGYTALMVQYTYKPANIVHLNCHLIFGSGSTKDYENEKSNMLDNFGNVTGARFNIVEPGINGEINLGVKTRLIVGVAYRYVYGIDQYSEYVSKTHISDGELSGFNFTAGVKFGLY